MNHNEELVQLMVDAIKQHKPLPPMPRDLSLEQAYSLQHQLSRQVNGKTPVGIKAGLTAAAVQRHFGLSEGVIGSLYDAGRLNSECDISAISGMLFECEIGVIVDAAGNPKTVLPVIEIVYLKYSEPSDLTAANIIAANVGADRIVCGETLPWNNRYEKTKISVRKNGEAIVESTIRESLDGVCSGTKWMLAEADKRHFLIEDGMLLILGTCGAAIAADVGKYSVDYGALGAVNFTVS